MNMTEGVIWKQLIAFAMPLLVGNLFQQLYNTVDSVVVGNFIGSEALAVSLYLSIMGPRMIRNFTGRFIPAWH